jgi:hypothetical protein
MFSEPEIRINGIALTTAQAMSVRVAVSSFFMELSDEDALGEDDSGKSIREGYSKALSDVLKLMQK